MKIKKLTVSNYKRFIRPQTFEFTDPDGIVNEQTLIIGDNGSGKTSLLQAIVILIATLTRENFKPDSLDWAGYKYRFLQSGELPLQIEATILFEENEIEKTIDYAQKLKEKGIELVIPNERHQIHKEKEVNIYLDFEKQIVTTRGFPGMLMKAMIFDQFQGYEFAKRLASFTPNKSELFEHVGNIYWYTEQRTSYNFSLSNDGEQELDFIRNFLSNAYNYHLALTRGERTMREGEFDFYEKIERIYKMVFPDRFFVGSTPRFDIFENSKAPDFFLSDGKNQYEIAGMSAGERAIFPILMDFARWNINNSIIIIDEVELHLHPPLQQALVRVLPKLGNNNQFIFSSHSVNVAAMFNEEDQQIIQLENE